MTLRGANLLRGTVEVDETYVGGNPSEVFLVNDPDNQLPDLPATGPLIHLFSATLQQCLQKKTVAWNWVTQVLGLRPFSLRIYIMDRLLPWMSEQSGDGAVQKLIAATGFIAANLESLATADRTTLQEHLPWITDSQMLKLCFSAMLNATESDPEELQRLQLLRELRNASREGSTDWN